MRLRPHVDVDVERVAGGEAAGRMHDHGVACVRPLGIKRPLDRERPVVPHVSEHTPLRAALEREVEPRGPAFAGAQRGERRRRKVTRAHAAAVIPRCAQPVIRRSSTANASYITIAITPITNRPAKTNGIRIDEPAAIIR